MHLLMRPAACFILAGLISLAVAAAPAIAQDSAKKVTYHDSLFWKVKSDTATVYIVGTIHAARPDFYPLPTHVRRAFEESDKLVLEIPLDMQTQLETMKKLMDAAVYPPGDSLENHLTPELKELLDAKIAAMDLPDVANSRFKPWFISVSLALMALQKAGFDLGLGLDQHFQKLAGDSKPVMGLETVDEQVALFASLDDQIQQPMLKQTLEQLDEIEKIINQVADAWKKNDAATIDKLLLDPMRKDEYKAVMKRIFTDRNERMAAKIQELLQTRGIYFVAVGAGHVIGPGGIVDRLIEADLAVEPQ